MTPYVAEKNVQEFGGAVASLQKNEYVLLMLA